MNRRQILQTVPAITVAVLLPSIAEAAPALELPPSFDLRTERDKEEVGVVRSDAFWKPYGDDFFMVSTYGAKILAPWWPSDLPYWGPTTEAQAVEIFKEEVARNYLESRRFFEKYGMGWIQAAGLGFRPEPECHQGSLRMWRRFRDGWRLTHSWTLCRNEYTPEELERASLARNAWLASGKTDQDAFPGWSAPQRS